MSSTVAGQITHVTTLQKMVCIFMQPVRQAVIVKRIVLEKDAGEKKEHCKQKYRLIWFYS